MEGRVTSDYAQSVAYKEAEDAFVNQLDDKTAAGLWQGEFWGKWIISACRAAYFAVYSLCDLGFFEESGKIGRAKAFRKTY
ncbi:MAG: hypothetical protein J6L83_02080 [Clostridia bacterium]|nr:hypothetical protein [Clostridia bacterium]